MNNQAVLFEYIKTLDSWKSSVQMLREEGQTLVPIELLESAIGHIEEVARGLVSMHLDWEEIGRLMEQLRQHLEGP